MSVTGEKERKKARDMGGSGVKLFPRCKGPITKGRSPVLLNFETVANLFGSPQCEAAQELGISITTLKQVRCQTGQMVEARQDAGDNACDREGEGRAGGSQGAGARERAYPCHEQDKEPLFSFVELLLTPLSPRRYVARSAWCDGRTLD